MNSEFPGLDALQKIEERKPDEADIIRLTTGVVLRGRKISPSLLIEVITSKARPKPPTYHNEKMGRTMENVDDPDYIERVQAYKYEQAGALVTVMILMGTEIVSIPAEMEGPHPQVILTGRGKEKKEETVWPRWLEEYELLNLPMRPDSVSWRYLTWVKFRAAPEDEDMKLIQEVVGRLSGIRETDVQAAEEFPERNKKSR